MTYEKNPVLTKVMTEPDYTLRLAELGKVLAAYERFVSQAREARVATVVEMRDSGMTWPQIRDVTGWSEQYLRKMAQAYREEAKSE